MTKYNVKVKNGIAFNLDDPFQLKLYQHICRTPNVSGYLKRLVAMDMEGVRPAFRTTSVEEIPVEEETLDSDMMLNLI